MSNLQDFTNRSEVGAIKPWGKATAPVGYVLCDGSAISRTTYADLFAVISTTYGTGNGSTTFNVPNLQGKTPQGYDGNTYNLAGTGGANTVTVSVTNNQAATNTNNQAVSVTGSIANTSLTTAQLASHNHKLDAMPDNPGDPYETQTKRNYFNENSALPTNNPMTNSGSGTGHTHTHTLSGTLTGSVTTSLTGTVAATGTNAFSPYVVVNYIIKH
jgi:microcystin-dependent protein